jgi:hypothetical protein
MISGPSATTPAVAPQRSLAKLDSSPARRRCTRPVRDEALDWLQLGRTLWRRKLFLSGLVVVVLGLTAAFLGRMPPIYEAEALLMLNQREPRVTPEISELLPPVAAREDALRAEILLIRSRGMAERMSDSLDLHRAGSLWFRRSEAGRPAPSQDRLPNRGRHHNGPEG